jgi:hypothetical protein
VAALIVAWRVQGRAGSSAAPASPPDDVRYVLVGADSHGSVVLDTASRTFTGYDSHGAAVWTYPTGRASVGMASCLAHCPDAVLSGDRAAFGAASGSGRPVRWQLGQTQLSEQAGHGGAAAIKTVYAAASPGLSLLGGTDRGGQPVIELRDRPRRSVYLPIQRDAAQAAVIATPELAAGFVLTPSPTYRRLHDLDWIVRGARGWHVSQQATVDAWAGCISADGKLAVLIGSRTQLLPFGSTGGGALAVRHAASCAFDRAGPVVIASAGTPQDTRTELAQFDPIGRLLWKQTFAGVYSASAVPASSSVVLYGQGRYVALDGSGQVDKTGSAQAAALLGPDRILLVTGTGGVATVSL